MNVSVTCAKGKKKVKRENVNVQSNSKCSGSNGDAEGSSSGSCCVDNLSGNSDATPEKWMGGRKVKGYIRMRRDKDAPKPV